MIKDTRFPNFHNDPTHKSRHPSLKNRFRKAVCINWLLHGGAAHEHVSNETLLTGSWFQTRFLGFDRDKTTSVIAYRREIGNGFVMHLWNNSLMITIYLIKNKNLKQKKIDVLKFSQGLCMYVYISFQSAYIV